MSVSILPAVEVNFRLVDNLNDGVDFSSLVDMILFRFRFQFWPD